MTYKELGDQLKITPGTTDKLVRDMVIVGHAEANRKTGSITALQFTPEEAAKIIVSFCRSHVLYRTVLERLGVAERFSLEDVVRVATELYSRLRLSSAVLEQYARRVMQWCVAAGLIDSVGYDYIASSALHGVSGLTTSGSRTRRGRGYFLGEAPPERTVEVLLELATHKPDRDQLISRFGMKSFQSLCALGLADNRGALLVGIDNDPVSAVRDAAKANPALHTVKRIIEFEPDVTGPTLGARLGAELGATWTKESCNRFGNSLRRLVAWTWPEEFEWRGEGRYRRLFPRE